MPSGNVKSQLTTTKDPGVESESASAVVADGLDDVAEAIAAE